MKPKRPYEKPIVTVTNYGRYSLDDNGFVRHGTDPHQERVVTQYDKVIERDIRYYPDGWQPYTEHEKFVVLVLAAYRACRSKDEGMPIISALPNVIEILSFDMNTHMLKYQLRYMGFQRVRIEKVKVDASGANFEIDCIYYDRKSSEYKTEEAKIAFSVGYSYDVQGVIATFGGSSAPATRLYDEYGKYISSARTEHRHITVGKVMGKMRYLKLGFSIFGREISCWFLGKDFIPQYAAKTEENATFDGIYFPFTGVVSYNEMLHGVEAGSVYSL